MTKEHRLRRGKLIATGAVLLAVSAFAGAHLLPVPDFWRALIRAAGEAGMVGGLADWFAVTALFRHPLGLPIPHTALIPNRKDDIGRSLAQFIEEHFLDPALLLKRLKEKDRALELGTWLQRPQASAFVGQRLVEAMRGLVRAGSHLDLVDAVLPVLREVSEGLEDALAREVGRRTGAFVPALVDRSLAKAGSTLLAGVIRALGTSGSAERAALDNWFRARFAEAPAEIQNSARQVWDGLRQELEDPERETSPALSDTITALVERAGAMIEGSPALRAWINGALERFVLDYIVPWRHQIGHYIEEVVRQWNPKEVTRIIELQVGHDLQYIRLNGTAIGALIGIGLFLISWFTGLQ